MKTFEDLNFEYINHSPYQTGKKSRMSFENGYGISVVSHTHSYGGKYGLFEVAVLDSNDKITYDTSVTNDVIGYLTEEKVSELMAEVQKL